MIINDDQSPTTITVNGLKVEEVNTFKYLGALFDSGARYTTEVRSCILQGRERMGQLCRLWNNRTLSPKLKTRLIQTLVWPIVTYGSEAWTLNKELTGNIEAFGMWCYRRAMRISYVEHVSNDEVLRRATETRKLLSRIRLKKLEHFGHFSRHPSLQSDIMSGKMPGVRRKGGQRAEWLNDITGWVGESLPSVVNLARDRSTWRTLSHRIVDAPNGVGQAWMSLSCTIWNIARYWLKIADFYLPHIYLAFPLGVIPLEFCRDLWHQKTRVHGLSYGVFAWSCLAVLVQYQRVIDRKTDGHIDDSIYLLA